MHPWLWIAVTIILDGIAGLAGGLFSDRWLARFESLLIGFAAGALVAAAFFDVLPEAVEEYGHNALMWAFAGFVVSALLEWVLGHHHAAHSHDHAYEDGAPSAAAPDQAPPEHTHGAPGIRGRALPWTLLGSDALHNIGDGAAIAAAFLVSTHAGIGVALAVIVHEIPQEVGDYALLRNAGFTRGRALLSLAAVQLTAAAGAAAVALASTGVKAVIPVVLSVAAGTFLYIGATDLLPEVHSGHSPHDRRVRMLGFLAGLAVVVVVGLIER